MSNGISFRNIHGVDCNAVQKTVANLHYGFDRT